MKKARALVAAVCVLASLLAGLTACGKPKGAAAAWPDFTGGTYMTFANTALQDLLKNFWQGDAAGNMMKEDHGLPTTGKQTMIWAHAQMLFAMDTLYMATNDDTLKQYMVSQWNWTKQNFKATELARAGQAPNIAVDDAGWDAMAYMLWYQLSGDQTAVAAASALLNNAYDYWQDGDTAGGLWYPQNPPSHTGGADMSYKSLYSASLVLAGIELYGVTHDDAQFARTMNVYHWMEDNLRRDTVKIYTDGLQDGSAYTVSVTDNLYWCDFNVDRDGRTEKNGPDGGTRPLDIQAAGSVCFLGGNMAMGVIQARLYKLTGDQTYLDRALQTVNALTDGPYNSNGIFLNDRDAWTDGAFVGWWVNDVLTLPGVPDTARSMIYDTAKSIAAHARTADGYYGADWDGGTRWASGGTQPQQIMTSANSANMIMAAALLEKLTA
ncbi:MAG: glycoside hydrolase family 76 protein [Oscillospiraceae bacterium]|nr:glycoside hydrolase family 76 protein [Oscillospiraceae bacterium]